MYKNNSSIVLTKGNVKVFKYLLVSKLMGIMMSDFELESLEKTVSNFVNFLLENGPTWDRPSNYTKFDNILERMEFILLSEYGVLYVEYPHSIELRIRNQRFLIINKLSGFHYLYI